MEDKMYTLKDTKDMTFKKKISHIWEYYRVHIFGTLLVIIIGGSWIYNAFLKPHKNLYAGVGIYNYKLPEMTEDPVYTPLNEKLGIIDTQSEATVEYFFIDNAEAGMDAAVTGKLSALMLTGDINVIIMNEGDMAMYIVEDYLKDLSEVYSPEELDAMNSEGLLFKSKTETDNEMKFYAVNLKNSSILKALPNFNCEDYYIGIFGGAPNEDDAKGKPSLENAARVVKALTD